jgi:hypothetical protein
MTQVIECVPSKALSLKSSTLDRKKKGRKEGRKERKKEGRKEGKNLKKKEGKKDSRAMDIVLEHVVRMHETLDSIHSIKIKTKPDGQ